MYTMSRVANRIYGDKGITKKSLSAPTARRPHYDWKMSTKQAERGELPPAPHVDAQRQRLLADIVRLAAADDRTTLRNIAIPSYNTHVRALARYRDLCIMALKVRNG
jgi:hypothetical protein